MVDIPARGVVVVDFFTQWCGPCKQMVKLVDGIGTQFGDRIRVMKVDCEANPDVSDKFQVRSVPTVVVLKDGQETGRHVGMVQQAELTASVSSVL